jgi:hypothetical protein
MSKVTCQVCKQLIPDGTLLCTNCQGSPPPWQWPTSPPEPESDDDSLGLFGWFVCIVVGMFLLGSLLGCGTVGGTVSGAGKDLYKLGEWITQK